VVSGEHVHHPACLALPTRYPVLNHTAIVARASVPVLQNSCGRAQHPSATVTSSPLQQQVAQHAACQPATRSSQHCLMGAALPASPAAQPVRVLLLMSCTV
jgi:hypothetical protein